MPTRGQRAKRKEDDKKSRPFRFRLNPEYFDEAELIEIIGKYQQNGIGLRELFRKAVFHYEGRDLPENEMPISANEIQEIKKMLFSINEHLENAEFGIKQPTTTKSKKSKELKVSKGFLDSLTRFVNDGMYADDQE